MAIKLANNAASVLAGNITSSDTTVIVVPGDGAKFPALSAGDWFPATIVKANGDFEIIKVTGRSTDTMTAVRGHESTLQYAFSAGDRIELRLTAGVIEAIEAQIESTAALLPPGTGPIPWSRPTEPAGWIFADGRTLLSDTPYSALRSAYISDGFPHGQDGSGNPKIPDMRGRVPAGIDSGAGRLTGATLGAGLGAQTHTLTSTEMPSHAHGVTDPGHAHGISDPTHSHGGSTATGGSHSHTVSAWNNAGGGISVSSAGGGITTQSSITSSTHSGHTHGVTINAAYTGVSVNGAYTGISTQSAGSGGAHNNVQPTLVTNFILKT